MTCSQHQKVTIMILKVDLQCSKCYKKVKKILRKFPQIRDQIYDEKQNTVIITVVCCSPERIMHKLCSNGRKTIKSIEIKEPKQAAPEPEKPKPKPVPQPQAKPQPAPAPVPVEKPQMNKAAAAAGPVGQWIPAYPPQQMYPVSVCCGPCYEGRLGGPCNQYGRPAFYGNSSCDYFTEHNPSACSIM